MMLSRSVSRWFSGAMALGVMTLGALMLGGCGGDGNGDGEDPPATCSSTGAAICEAACECGGSAGCSIGDEESSITFDNKQDCLMLYALACSQPSSGVDYTACQNALKTPTCVASVDGMTLKTPPECDEPETEQ